MFGELFKKHRLATGKTLRAFCNDHGHDPGNVSRIERGKSAPPESADVLNRFAADLGLGAGTTEHQEFLDAAAAERGKVPGDLMNDADLVEKLPLLFRSLRGIKDGNDRDALREFAEEIRRI